jgi:hypothetical protein
VLVVGAGMAGLAAAARLRRAGHGVLVIDKGRSVGGRLASRRIGEAVFDHGAQFMTARDARFAAAIAEWERDGTAREWFRRARTDGSERACWRGMPTMAAVAKHLARDLDVRVTATVTALEEAEHGWQVSVEHGEIPSARAVLLTPPVPQGLALLDAGDVRLPPETLAALTALEYERCLAVMAVLAGPSRVPPPGGLAPEHDQIAWIADNQTKGTSPVPAVTIHATPAFSLAHWDDDRHEAGQALLDAAHQWLGAHVTALQVHGWRYSRPLVIHRERCVVLEGAHPLVFAGDAFAGPRVEGAALSGWAAAAALEQRLSSA